MKLRHRIISHPTFCTKNQQKQNLNMFNKIRNNNNFNSVYLPQPKSYQICNTSFLSIEDSLQQEYFERTQLKLRNNSSRQNDFFINDFLEVPFINETQIQEDNLQEEYNQFVINQFRTYKQKPLRNKYSNEQNLFTINEEDLQNDSQALSSSYRDNNYKIYLIQNIRSTNSPSKTNIQSYKCQQQKCEQIQALSSIQSKQLNRYLSDQCLEVHSFNENKQTQNNQQETYYSQALHFPSSNKNTRIQDLHSLLSEKKNSEETCLTEQTQKHQIRRSIQSIIMDQQFIGTIMPSFIKNQFKNLQDNAILDYFKKRQSIKPVINENKICSQPSIEQIQKIRQIMRIQIERGCSIQLVKRQNQRNIQKTDQIEKRVHKLQFYKNQERRQPTSSVKKNAKGLSLIKTNNLRS